MKRTTTRRMPTAFAGSAALALTVAACGGAGEASTVATDKNLVIGGETVATPELLQQCKDQGSEVHIYGTTPAEQFTTVIEQVEQDTGVKVTQTRATSSEIFTKVTAEAAGGKLTADIIGLNDPTLRQKLVEAKVIQKFTNPMLEARGNDFDPSGYSQEATIASQVLVWNSQLVKDEDAPKSYEDLLRPEYKGKIGMTAIQTGLSSITVAKSMWDKKGEEWVERFAAQDPKIYTSVVPLTQAVVRGEIPMAITDLSITQNYIKEGNPLKFSAIEEGTPSWFSFQTVSATTPRLACAQIYLSWTLTEEGGKKYYEATGFVPRRFVDNPPADAPKIGNPYVVDTDWLLQNRDSFVAQWQGIFGKK